MHPNDLIVIRHVGALEWLREQGIDAPVVEHVRKPGIVRGKDVYGILPLHLASLCRSYNCIDIPDLPLTMRGMELSKEQMYQYGARLRKFVIREVK